MQDGQEVQLWHSATGAVPLLMLWAGVGPRWPGVRALVTHQEPHGEGHFPGPPRASRAVAHVWLISAALRTGWEAVLVREDVVGVCGNFYVGMGSKGRIQGGSLAGTCRPSCPQTGSKYQAGQAARWTGKVGGPESYSRFMSYLLGLQ